MPPLLYKITPLRGGSAAFTNTKSLSLNGVDQYVDGGTSIYNFDTSSTFSFSAWVYLGNAGDANGEAIIGRQDASHVGYHFLVLSNELWFGLQSGTGTAQVASPALIANNTWTHLACTYNGNGSVSGMALYINGSLVTPTTIQDNLSGSTQTTANFYIGNFAAAGTFLNGKIDELSIFTSVLTAANITMIYNAGHPGDITVLSPQTWLRFENNFTDSGSNAFTFSGVNSPTFSASVP